MKFNSRQLNKKNKKNINKKIKNLNQPIQVTKLSYYKIIK